MMDSADGNFRACFIGIGDHAEKIGNYVLSEFNCLMRYYERHRDDDPTSSADNNEYPLLTVLSFSENQDQPQQNVIFLVGSQQDPLFWSTREKLISGNKYSFLFTLSLPVSGDIGWQGQSSNKESIIFCEESDSEKEITQFVKDTCRLWMFPRLLSCDFSSMREALSGTNGKTLSFESQTVDCLPSFRQFVSRNHETIQRASGVFYIVSSNFGSDFSIRTHLQPFIDEIERVANGECTFVGCDSLYAEKEAAFRVTLICGEK